HLLLALDVVPRDQLEARIKAVRGGQRVTWQDPEETYQALEKFGRDLTAAAEAGKLDPVMGRVEEIRRVIQVLARRMKNNPLVVRVVPRHKLEARTKAVGGGQRVTSQDPEETYQALEKFGRDLTAAAEAGKLDPVIGRDEEIRRVIQVLSRRTKNNPVLIGDP